MQKAEQISNALAGMIQDGDQFTVVGKDGGIDVRPVPTKDALRVINPDLHGRLLAYEQKLMGSGMEVWWFLLGALAVDITISTNVTKGAGLDLANWQTWWVYVGSFVIAVTLNTFRLTARVAREFRKLGPAIRAEVAKAKISEGELLSLLEGDSKLYNVKHQLMLSGE